MAIFIADLLFIQLISLYQVHDYSSFFFLLFPNNKASTNDSSFDVYRILPYLIVKKPKNSNNIKDADEGGKSLLGK